MIKMVRKITVMILKYYKEHPARAILLLGFLIIVVIPFVLQLVIYLLSFGMFNIGTNDGWLGFWGGYLGALIGIPISVFIALYTVRSEKKQLMTLNYVKYLEKMSDSAVELGITMISLTKYDIKLNFSSQIVSFYMKELEPIVTGQRDKFYREFCVNRLKLPDNKREIAKAESSIYFKMIEELYKEYIQLGMDLNQSVRSMQVYEKKFGYDTKDIDIYNKNSLRLEGKINHINELLKKTSNQLIEISSTVTSEIKM